MDRELRAGVQSIVRQAIAAVLPDEAVRRALAAFTPGPGRVLLVAAGKAAWADGPRRAGRAAPRGRRGCHHQIRPRAGRAARRDLL